MNLREIHITDAEAYIELLSQLERESPYVLLEEGERKTGILEQMDEIREIEASDNQIIFVVEDRDKLVAWCGAFGEKYRRVRHTVLIGIGVLEAYRAQGWGTKLFEALEEWAWKQDIRRLELLVQTENKAGIALYRKMGFQIEGTKRESYMINGGFVDEYLMSKLLVVPDPPRKSKFPKW